MSAGFEAVLPDGVKINLQALQGGIFRFQAGGYDGYVTSLLERYGIVNDLPAASDARADKNGVAAGDCSLSLDGQGFVLTRGGETLLTTLPGTIAATHPTIHSNRGCVLRLPVSEGERFVGFGDHARNAFLLNGKKSELWIRYPVQHIPVPFFLSSRGYGIFLNTTRRVLFDFNSSANGAVSIQVNKGFADFYIIPGASYDEIIYKYCTLTGFPVIPPLKSFGLWFIMHSQATGHDVLNFARAMRDDKIPCDNISLEPDWMQNRYDPTVNKEWNDVKFRGCPNSTYRAGPDHMIRALNRMGYELGLWLCTRWDFTHEEERRLAASPAAATDSMPDLDGVELSHFDENVGHTPIYMDETTKRDEPWFEHLKKFVKDGARFFKVDPAWLINEFPDRLYGNGKTEEEMHNLTFLLCSKQMAGDYEAFTGRRSFGIAVAGWAGQQRFAGTWAGDTGGGPQPLAGILQDATIGHSYATCDMKTDEISGLHMGFLLPWALINSWSYFHYPVYQSEELRASYREYANLRMSLMPYLYSLARRAQTQAKAMARPLFFYYPQVEKSYQLLSQYMLGESLLITAYQGNKVTLPTGRWLDFWTGTVYEGDWSEREIALPHNRGGHIFLKEGGLVPTIAPMQHVYERAVEEVTWIVFPAAAGGTSSEFNLYFDDGDSLGYREGKFGEVTVTLRAEEEGFSLAFGEVSGAEAERVAKLRHRIEVRGAMVSGAAANGQTLTVANGLTGTFATGAQVVVNVQP